MLPSDHVYQKLITHSQAMQNILLVLCRCIICQSRVAIILFCDIRKFVELLKKVNYAANENNAGNCRSKHNKTATSKSFELKTKKIRRKLHDNNTLDTEIVVSLKYLSNFRRSLNLLLINSQMGLDLLRSTKFIITQIYNMLSNPNANPPNPSIFLTSTYHATFQINHTKTYSHQWFFLLT